ncbi:MAG TPA: matrixin family metalloprotease [Polyangiaceae bacterium]|nr:matrixin family metalloprotease [Polyangiaceae bacterium]
MRWNESQVSYVIDPSVHSAVSGGADAVAQAVSAWSGVSGAPALSTSAGTKPAKGPAVDGNNVVLFAPKGYAPAGNALAITILSFDSQTGAIVDADVVVNGAHKFAALPAGALAAPGAVALSNEGSGDDDGRSSGAFDLQHVVAHEIGHSLGLGDQNDVHAALMYAYSKPGDATLRAPTTDDVDGLDQAYGGSPTHAGCGASVAGTRAGLADGWAVLALAGMAGAWRMSRRRARVFVPACAALAVLVVAPVRARSAVSQSFVVGDATARVVASTAVDVDGVFQTTLELESASCRSTACPQHAVARVWGGTLGNITQQVGDNPVPRPGEVVAIAFAGDRPQGEATDHVEATILADHDF